MYFSPTMTWLVIYEVDLCVGESLILGDQLDQKLANIINRLFLKLLCLIT